MRISLLLILSISLSLFSCIEDDDDTITQPGTPCTNTPALTTNAASNITVASAILSGTIIAPTCDTSVVSQGFVWAKNALPILTDSLILVSGDSISYLLTQLDFEETYYYRTFFTNSTGTYYGNEVSFKTDTLRNAVYLDSNGVTIKANDWAKVGDTGNVNGVLYTIVDEQTFRNLIQSESDVTNICVSKITKMHNLFQVSPNSRGRFNQDISSWDVSNVTLMGSMFNGVSSFNQPLNNWDVSNVLDMGGMFVFASSFNQPLNNWDVSSVTDMGSMFYNASSFNQRLNNWAVSEVTDCINFSFDANNWTLPKPIFTNCTP